MAEHPNGVPPAEATDLAAWLEQKTAALEAETDAELAQLLPRGVVAAHLRRLRAELSALARFVEVEFAQRLQGVTTAREEEMARRVVMGEALKRLDAIQARAVAEIRAAPRVTRADLDRRRREREGR